MISFTIRQLEYFQAVVETGSATAAARMCFVSQAGLSAGISQLENAVGDLLFRREKAKTLTLTPAGQAFAKAALRTLKDLQELEDSATTFRKVLSGTLQLGCFHSLSPLLLPHLAEQFSKHHPHVNLQFLEAAPPRTRTRIT